MGSIARSESFEEPSLLHLNSSDKNLTNLDFYQYSDFVLARPEKVRPIYSKFRDQQVIIEGPERNTDLTYWLVSMQPDLTDLERGIKEEDFDPSKRRPDMEFRILDRMTGHKDHVANLFVRSHKKFNDRNRYPEVLTFKHNRVELKNTPFFLSEEDLEENELEKYYNASEINSNVYP